MDDDETGQKDEDGRVTVRFVVGDTRDVTATLDDGSIDLIVTSPPFLALRSYLPAGHADKAKEIGSEANPAAFLDVLLGLTAEWGRVLAPHGTLAVELGDTYSGNNDPGWGRTSGPEYDTVAKRRGGTASNGNRSSFGWPLAKSLALIPQLYAIALAYGINPLTGQPSPAGRWRVRNWLAWHRKNPAVGGLGDKWRPASSYITVACRGTRRWFDLDSVRSSYSENTHARTAQAVDMQERTAKTSPDGNRATLADVNNNGVGAPPLDWHTDGDLGTGHIILATAPYPGSHYATFPPELPRKIIDCMCPRSVCRVCGVPRERVTGETQYDGPHRPLRGDDARRYGSIDGKRHNDHRATSHEHVGWSDCSCRFDRDGDPFHGAYTKYRPGLVYDPFCGTGTTLMAAQDLGRDAIGADLDPRNADLARERCGMFLEVDDGTVPRPVVNLHSPLL